MSSALHRLIQLVPPPPQPKGLLSTIQFPLNLQLESQKEYETYCKLYGQGIWKFSTGTHSGNYLTMMNAYTALGIMHYAENVDQLKACVEFQNPEITIDGRSIALSDLLPHAVPLLHNDRACSAFELFLDGRVTTIVLDLKDTENPFVYRGTQLQLLVDSVAGESVNTLLLDERWEKVVFMEIGS